VSVQTFTPADFDQPGFVRGEQVVTCVTVWPRAAHDVVNVWNRGGHAGELIVASGDGDVVARLLLPREPVPEGGLT
jgi:hypothetical protein